MRIKLEYSGLGTVFMFFIVYQLMIAPESILTIINNTMVSKLLESTMLILATLFIFYTYNYVNQINYWQGGFFKKREHSWLPLVISIWILLFLQWGDSFLIAKGIISNTQNQTELLKKFDDYPIYMLISGNVMAPFIEELIFRGLFYKLLFNAIDADQFKKRVLFLIIFLNTIIFAVPHLSSVSFDFIPYMLIAIIFSINFIYYKNIEIPIVLHMMNNLIASFLV